MCVSGGKKQFFGKFFVRSKRMILNMYLRALKDETEAAIAGVL